LCTKGTTAQGSGVEGACSFPGRPEAILPPYHTEAWLLKEQGSSRLSALQQQCDFSFLRGEVERIKQTMKTVEATASIICTLCSAPVLSSAYSSLEVSQNNSLSHRHPGPGQLLPLARRLFFYGSPHYMFLIHFLHLSPNEDALPLLFLILLLLPNSYFLKVPLKFSL